MLRCVHLARFFKNIVPLWMCTGSNFWELPFGHTACDWREYMTMFRVVFLSLNHKWTISTVDQWILIQIVTDSCPHRFFGSVLFCILILSCKHAVTNNAMCTHVGHHFIWIRTKHDWWVSLSLLNCADSVWMNCSGLWIIYIALLKPPMIIYGFVWNLGTQKPLNPHGLSACSPLKQQFGFVCFLNPDADPDIICIMCPIYYSTK